MSFLVVGGLEVKNGNFHGCYIGGPPLPCRQRMPMQHIMEFPELFRSIKFFMTSLRRNRSLYYSGEEATLRTRPGSRPVRHSSRPLI
jgi:hypothetical protein